ncbi:uncharacterized protein J3R85_004891 [Psidium guajava]|nr:uncharacterized protein J3R85_004891 [Psidium guajava]
MPFLSRLSAPSSGHDPFHRGGNSGKNLKFSVCFVGLGVRSPCCVCLLTDMGRIA